MAYETILYEKKGRVVYVTLNRPEKLNAISDQLSDELIYAGREFDADPDAWVAILSGAGRAFSSGADVRQRQLRPMEELQRLGGPGGGLRDAGGSMGLGRTVNWKPVIAAVHGYVIGAGLGLAMSCDLVVAAHGTKLQIREVQRGLGGATHWASIHFWGGGRFANELAMTGRMFDAEEALHHGIVNRVVLEDRLMAEAEQMAEEIMANPPLSVRSNVRVIRTRVRQVTHETAVMTGGEKLALTEDFRESAQAFIEKRPPVFKGR